MESNIQKLRRKMGLTQKELGKRIGVSQQVISRIERERNQIPVDVLIQLAEIFKVSTDCVLGYRESVEAVSYPVKALSSMNIRKEDVLLVLEQAENLRTQDWLSLWFMVNALNDKS